MPFNLGIGLGLSRRGGAIGPSVIGLRTGATPNGRTSTDTLKVVGVDSLPSGMSISGQSVIVTALQETIDNWDFTGYTLDVRAFVRRVTQCVFADGSVTTLLYYITGNSSGAIRELDYCTFTGRGDHLGAGVVINCAVSGTGSGVTALEVDYIHHCRFLRTGGDAIKSAGSTYWNGQRIEWCYFGRPENLPTAPTVWNSATTYALNDCVTDPITGWFYVSKTDGNLNNALPPGVSKTEENTYWLGIDPHADAITTVASINRTSIRKCLFDWSNQLPGEPDIENQTGVNNVFRFNRNSGTDFLLDQILVENCEAFFSTDFVSYIVQVGDNGLGNWNGPIIFRSTTLGANASGQYFHPTTNGAVDYWINTTGTAPTGAITTDASAAPTWSVSPALTGTATVGGTLTATVGGATGFPSPFYDLSIEVSDDGLSGWSVVSTDNETLVLGAGDVGKYFRASVRAWNSAGEVVDVSSALGPVAAGYSMARVDTNGTARLTVTPGGTAQCVTFSGWFTVASFSSPSAPRLVRSSNALDVYIGTGGQVNFAVWNASGTQIYAAASAAGTVSVGVPFHIFASYDGNTATPFVAVNGATITMTPTLGPLTGSTRPNRGHEIGHTGTLVTDMTIGDFWLEYGSAVQSLATFWNGGTPPDLTGVGSPQVWLGGTMRADQDSTGDTAKGWNDGFNLGSATMTVVSGTYTDV